MPTTPEYALFAANSYATLDKVVSVDNVIKAPTDWITLKQEQMSNNPGINNTTGFLARAYKNASGEIVIAYGGTTPENSLDWGNGNLPGALGYELAPQVLDAARFYLDVVKANPRATITFTGHSLGGLTILHRRITIRYGEESVFCSTALLRSCFTSADFWAANDQP